MSGISKFKRIYSEGVAAEHPDVAGQKEFANKADAEITRRRKERAKKGGPQLPGFVASVKKEETELGEGIQPLPREKMLSKIVRKSGAAHSANSFRKDYTKRGLKDLESKQREKVANKASQIKKIKSTLRTHDPLESRFKELENQDRGEKKSKTKLEKDYKLSSDGKYRRRSKVKEEVELDEKIDVGADAGATISDFVHSKSKKQRIKRALGAYYAAQKEETENIYNYVIETLVDSEFAEDYETAENIFEHMSSEFLAVILEEYIEEARRSRTERRASNAGRKGYDAKGNPIPRVSTTHVIHDVDDNLGDQRHPDAARIDLYKKDSGSYKHVKAMTPSEFAHTPLEPKHTYGFNAFLKTKLFKDTTKPIKPVARMGDSPRRPAKKSVVTARGGSAFGSNKPSTPMDESFAKDLRDRIGVRGIEKPNIHFTGGMSKGSNKGLSGPEKKAKVVAQIVNPDTKKVITTDDHLGNTRAMAAAASAAAPQAKVIAYQSRPATRKPKGKGKVGDIVPSRVGKENKPEDTNIGIRSKPDAPKSTTETQRARKKARKNMGEEMTPYEYWKQYIA